MSAEGIGSTALASSSCERGEGAKTRARFANSTECAACQTAFTMTVRRHHCRRCLDSFCARCQTKRCSLAEWPDESASRVCDACYDCLLKGGAGGPAVQPKLREHAMTMADKVLLAATKAKDMVDEMQMSAAERRRRTFEVWEQRTKLLPVTGDTATRTLGVGDTRDASLSGTIVFAKHPLAVGTTDESTLVSHFQYGDEVYGKAAWDRCLRNVALGVDVASGEPLFGWPHLAAVRDGKCIHEVNLWLELTVDGKRLPVHDGAYMCVRVDLPVAANDYRQGIAGDVWGWQRSWAFSEAIVKGVVEPGNSLFGQTMTDGQRWLACQLARLDGGVHTVRAELRWSVTSAIDEESVDWAVRHGRCEQEQLWPTKAMLAHMERSHVIAVGEFTITGGGLADTEEVRDMILPRRSVEECTERVEAAAWAYLKTSCEWGARPTRRDEPLYVAFAGLTGSYLHHSDSRCPQQRNGQHDCTCAKAARVYTGRCIAVCLRRERHGWDAARSGAIAANLTVESHSSSMAAPLRFSSAAGVRPFISAAIEPYMLQRAGLEP
uniref:FYVE-type domain-containing protein n=1 Tax=Sexangularia sp. CB-2014 TaxID=1486929 RepID=A0A7S1Y9U6_9EUKA